MSRSKFKQSKTRFTGQLHREKGAIIKDWGGRLPIALIYPNSYYLGMSNLGIHSIYRLLNSHRQVVCERVFWEKEPEGKKIPPASLESQRPLSDFAMLAFSISYELDYFNVVQILEASSIPLYAADRDESYPLVIGGGPCITANPIPLAPFFDCLCIGEAEPILPAMLPFLFEGMGSQRNELLKTLASLPGIYAPEHHSGTQVKRQWTRNLDEFPATSVIFTPDTELGNLCLIEAERGCGWGCRFCLVSAICGPMRFCSADNLIEQARQGLEHRRRIGLVGPAVADHPQIEEILARLRQMGAGLSISSLRASPLFGNILRELAKGGARTVTFAPEAGSQRLRQAIKKAISEDVILDAISETARAGIKHLKLYFMIGLPTETDEDIEEIVNLILAGKEIIDRQRSNTRIALNIAPFVPKAGTPFQWLPMASIQTLNRRISLLKKKLPAKGIKLKCESPAWSQIQGVLARGDARLAEVLADIEEVSLSGWKRAAEKCHLDTDFYVNQRWDISQKLPWAIIDSGARLEHLERELGKALD